MQVAIDSAYGLSSVPRQIVSETNAAFCQLGT